MNKLLPSLVLIVLGAAPAAALPFEPSAMPSPRPQGWVVDRADLLSPDQEAVLNSLGDQVHARDGAALAVLTVRSAGTMAPRQAATKVFDHWGLGDARRHNGLLIFVAIDDRAAELVLGEGIDSDAQVAISERILQDLMVPRFRSGDADRAILDGARASAERFFGVVPPPLEALPVAARPKFHRPWWQRWSGLQILAAIFLPGFAMVVLVAYLQNLWRRHRPRRCPNCRQGMTRLDETLDDQHLATGEKVEEMLGTVDYDVWFCQGCEHVEKLRYQAFGTGYSRCRQCRSVTKTSSRKTLQASTTTSTGLVEIQETCAACGYDHTFTRAIPLERTTSATTPRGFSSGGSFWGGRGRSSGGGGRSSRGGGRSSGRGASGRW